MFIFPIPSYGKKGEATHQSNETSGSTVIAAIHHPCLVDSDYTPLPQDGAEFLSQTKARVHTLELIVLQWLLFWKQTDFNKCLYMEGSVIPMTLMLNALAALQTL
ncbi:hypothetical protein CDAR_591131 [Caerostris darwini]|uniref:Uncharacterized protein n=1 Tax=Caerostris darwini TaxID=1538125 RepID=A0AAV4RKD2_9ARAC|nr:hypothetical protein CDAR_591131 [Caerostris darwini]